ncbi:MAG: response regulator transcription factor [Anaerolineales bacterium]|nr:response regulator transcription factor [Anaerolineales bacterium]
MTPIRVLLADDHAVVRAGIRQFLERAADLRVIAEADDGEMAQKLIAAHHPDVAVLDIQMPKATGIEVTRWARAHHPQIGILILTAYDDDPYVMAVLQAGANGYVLKTASPDEIVQAVREVYEGRSFLDPTIARKLLNQFASPSTSPLQIDDPQGYEALTDRETEVLTLVAKGFTNKAIAVQLTISDRTVQGHLAKIFIKLQAASRTEAVMRAVTLGWITTNLAP